MTTKLSSPKAKKSRAKSGAKKKSVKPSVAPKKQAKPKAVAQVPTLPRSPKGGPKDIGLLSFGKEAIRKRKPSKKSKGGAGIALAGSVADRKRVQDTRQSPFRKICDLVITAGDS